jgi:SAM-dependent methyltransferase
MSARPEQAAAAAVSTGITCIVCGGTGLQAHFHTTAGPPPRPDSAERYRITHSERRLVQAILRCRDCGMVMLPLSYAPPVSYEEATDPYYLEQAPQRIANAHRLLDLVPRGGRLLEIGCAAGFLLVAARERGFAARGVEMSAWAAAHARDAYGLDVTTGYLERIDLPAGHFDVVVMADVIEHLHDPRRTLQHIHRVLRPGGRLLLLTPDVGSLMARLAGRRWWGLLDDHYFYFSRATLRRLLESEGYAVERLCALGRGFPVAHWLFKIAPYSRRLHRAVDGAARWVGVDRLQVSINLGDQMACVAQKK